jgi:hypothetical protein
MVLKKQLFSFRLEEDMSQQINLSQIFDLFSCGKVMLNLFCVKEIKLYALNGLKFHVEVFRQGVFDKKLCDQVCQ